jgi:hypothetical protein
MPETKEQVAKQVIDDGGPAFPDPVGADPTWSTAYSTGMTLRDYFAAKAMAAMASHSKGGTTGLAEVAYQMADAMLIARKAGH